MMSQHRLSDWLRKLFQRKPSGPPPCSCEAPAKPARSSALRKRLARFNWRGLVLPLIAIALWWIVSALHLVKSGLLVSPADVAHTASQQIRSGALLRALSASLAREASGFVIGTAGGLLLGAALGLSRIATRVVGPSFDTFKQISLFAWIPLISVWFGLGDVAKVVFLSLAALLPVAAHTCDGIHAVPSIFTGIYLALIYSWLATLGAEYLLVAGSGIGNTLIDGSEQFRMDLVLFGIVVVGLTGWALNALARGIERRVFAQRSM
jgi:sulfonate transport system permease protein